MNIQELVAFGYCFTYTGGRSTKLKGTLGYYKVAPLSVSRSVVIGTKLADILNTNIVYIMHGEFTQEQARIVRHRSTINPYRVRAALEWLIDNNTEWKDIDLVDLHNALVEFEPKLIDLSTTAPQDPNSANQTEDQRRYLRDIESQESYAVYFPDGSLTPVYGGQTSAFDFEKIVLQAQEQGFDASVVSNLTRKFTNDYIDNNFVLSCMLQMPLEKVVQMKSDQPQMANV